MRPETKSLLNIIVLGLGFMLMFTAFQTCGNIEQTVIKSFNSTEFHGSGYTSMAIIYGVFSASNLIAPSVVAVIGPQLSLFFSGLIYSGYIAMFIHPFTWSFYTASVLVGIAAAVLWTAQGNLLTINSSDSSIGRNSGIFWALLQFSLFFGNLYIYVAWHGKVHISDKDRQTVFISLTIISLVGNFLFFLIQRTETEIVPSDRSESPLPAEASESDSVVIGPQGLGAQALVAFKKSIQLAMTKEMLLLSISIAYTGLELTFYSGVYGTSIGAMTRFGDDAKSLIGLAGIFIGVGEILGGSVFGMLNQCNQYGRNPVVLLGLITHILAFYLIFLNIASDAPLAPEEGTQLQGFISPSKELALFSSFLLGLGDSCFNTQLLSIVGFIFRDDSAPAFAVFKFVQSIAAALAFFYSNYLQLYWQLLIMVLVGFTGTLSFFMAEWMVVSCRQNSDYNSI
ncbi:UNC93-like protein MFSD11 [Hemibagrus wyckioides]|uniref:UNC93-like protein MFSD11 n=1 Tax=Hemibagrus wyckioides TaxID=337641 RepID=UPI00266C67BA|nr:UNC93-like protein MFSD11 [Hemibagrus wyckioides]XP_058267550.1 UNC93-like protein MFSD11 [Hemibagrus wyckioides]XP_058267560.1 UNC93-like protein MFSD11 [Hemibagrus wyckioides]XP_058267570.1 UNC93-like protein MFSD11 [Hemibagrus wyckioides]XP_058267580.1 UNC93-like protein MFSD11 [Hemibagrus wyckioides]XP_058267588.1 UNC93-like protein MFSD11 [Hemibagrus wyckioides]XP_058267598.1 UNC93-like protein MFSD11 [Hemibagrus wyckioides]